MKEKISIVVFILILGTFLTTVLVAVNQYTTPRVEKNKEMKLKVRVLYVLGVQYTEKEDIEKVFSQNIKTVKNDGGVFYVSNNKDVAFEFAGPGLWGPIYGVIALHPDLIRIKDIAIIHQEETPGLGGRIAEKAYLSKFKGKRILPRLNMVAQGKATGDNEVDGITGATMSSDALGRLLNSEVQKYLSHIKKEDI